jgi:APA family basic amino acid/polyamine antiporter
VAGGAVISTFGALNGWILVQGQMPYAAARDRLFPRIFAREDENGTPVLGIVISSVLVSALMMMNFSKTLANTYTFTVLLSTLAVLIPYLFSVISFVMLEHKNRGFTSHNALRYFIAILAFLYSMWAVIGSGAEIVYWGFVLLMAGLPFYAWIQMNKNQP